jgi:hypothetical protein
VAASPLTVSECSRWLSNNAIPLLRPASSPDVK